MKITHHHISKFTKLITLDTRSLGIFRIMLALVILVDLFVRAQHLEFFYTNAGVVRMEPTFIWLNHLSVHTMAGDAEYIGLLFWIAAFFAVLLMLGFLTPAVLPICWFLLISLHSRNSYVLNDGDTLIRLLMFMAIFLPLGARFSLDAILFKDWMRKVEDNYYSVWTLVYVFQLIIIYAVSGWAKFSKIWHFGQGIYYSMMLHTYAKASAAYLLKFPAVMILLNYYTLILERFGWLLLLSYKHSDRFRVLAVVLFTSFHFGLFLFMELGIFPLVAIAAWIPMIPSRVWDRYFPRTIGLKNRESENQTSGVGLLIFKRKKLPSYIIQLLGVVMIAINIYHNFDINDHPFIKIKPFDFLVQKLRIEQGWRVFTGPNTADGWYVIEAQLADGNTINLLKPDTPIHWAKPPVVSEEYETHRVRKYMRRIRDNIYQQKQLMLYLSKNWNHSHTADNQILKATFWSLEEQILPDLQFSPIEKTKKFELKSIE
jgi:hypothetical protein